MGRPRTGKGLTNEIRYPYIVELATNTDDLETKGRVLQFHNSRKIRIRQGRRIVREDKTYSRWCFPDFVTARAFIETFGGEVLQRKGKIAYAR
jgi:hypothetical protein